MGAIKQMSVIVAIKIDDENTVDIDDYILGVYVNLEDAIQAAYEYFDDPDAYPLLVDLYLLPTMEVYGVKCGNRRIIFSKREIYHGDGN